MKKFVTIFGFGFIFILQNSNAQGELDEQGKIFYRNERTFGLLLNSNGFGVNYRYGKRVNAFRKTIYDFDFVGIKHPREQKIPTDNFSLSRIVYGKLNEFYNLRAGIGVEKEMFSKVDRGGISIRRYFSFGTSFGLLKPIYYYIETIEYNQSGIPVSTSIIIDKFTKYQHIQSSIISRKASFFKGVDEISIIPGLYGKFGMMFEFGKVDEIIHAIDVGFTVDAFIKKAEIMATEDNRQFFLSLYASYRFGRVLDARFNQNRNKIDEILND